MLEGSEVCMTRKWSAHEAFTREAIVPSANWSGVLRNCRVPVILLQGDQDPQTPVKTIEELAPNTRTCASASFRTPDNCCSSPTGVWRWSRFNASLCAKPGILRAYPDWGMRGPEGRRRVASLSDTLF